MSTRRRMLAMFTASVAVLALGFVVSVAAAGLPGSGGEEPLLDIAFWADLDLSSVLSWILLGLAVVGAVLFAMGLGRRPTHQEGRRRGILGTVLGVILFVVIARFLRPAAEGLFGPGADAAETAAKALRDDGSGSLAGWILSVLLAAVLAAALTRIGLSVTSVPSGMQLDQGATSGGPVSLQGPPPPIPVTLGDDPRSRVISAYEGLEDSLARAGQVRRQSETTASHAIRAAGELGLEVGPVRDVVGHHSRARYGVAPVSDADAGLVESIVTVLRGTLPE